MEVACYPVCFWFCVLLGVPLVFGRHPVRPIVFHPSDLVRGPAYVAQWGWACVLFVLPFLLSRHRTRFRLCDIDQLHFCRNYRDFKALVFRLLPFAVSMPLVVLWMLFTHENEASVQTDPVVYGSDHRTADGAVHPASWERFFRSPCNVLVFGAILLVPGLAGGELSRRPERWVPFAVGMLIFMVLPRFALSTAYVFHRLGIFLVPLWLMAWDPPQPARSRNVDWAVMLVVVVWALASVGRFAGFAGETRSFDA